MAGIFGPCLTHAARADSGSTVQMVAQMLARAMADHYGVLNAASLALNLKDFLSSVALPSAISSSVMTEEELRSEIRDALAFRRSEQSRRAVEIARLRYAEKR